ncbi:MAG: FtsQ-type POTRA domain-containing protein [Actinobacteria bacterium]|nr:MAG: FtsQ-type POTRA domain-containing protein [Actinomycetota bacterium]
MKQSKKKQVLSQIKKAKREEKLTSLKKAKRKVMLQILTFVTIVSMVVYLLYTTPILQIKRIRVAGNKHNLSSDIISGSGIKIGQKILTINRADIIRKIERLPWVKKAGLGLLFFPLGCTIYVTERIPVFYVTTEGKKFCLDSDGYIIANKKDVSETYKIPVIELANTKITVATRLKTENFRNALAVYRRFSPKFASKISMIRAKNIEDLYLVVEGVTIIYGSSKKAKLKNTLIEKFLAEKTKPLVIDVRVPSNPVTRTMGK